MSLSRPCLSLSLKSNKKISSGEVKKQNKSSAILGAISSAPTARDEPVRGLDISIGTATVSDGAGRQERCEAPAAPGAPRGPALGSLPPRAEQFLRCCFILIINWNLHSPTAPKKQLLHVSFHYFAESM